MYLRTLKSIISQLDWSELILYGIIRLLVLLGIVVAGFLYCIHRWMFCHSTLYTHSWYQEDKTYRLWWSPNVFIYPVKDLNICWMDWNKSLYKPFMVLWPGQSPHIHNKCTVYCCSIQFLIILLLHTNIVRYFGLWNTKISLQPAALCV